MCSTNVQLAVMDPWHCDGEPFEPQEWYPLQQSATDVLTL